jgi:trk system potassium uptake protein TrkA
MHVVIVGADRVGGSLARWLVSSGHEVAVVDKNASKCAALDDALGSVSVTGNATDASVLAQAGASRSDVHIATTGRDEVNLVSCQLARHLFGVSKSISVVNSHENAELFGLLGIDVAVDVTELMLGRIQEGLTGHGVVHLMPVSDRERRSLVSIKISSDRNASRSRLLRDLAIPDGTIISLVITREGYASIPNGDTVIRTGDEVVAVTTDYEEGELRDLLVDGFEE